MARAGLHWLLALGVTVSAVAAVSSNAPPALQAKRIAANVFEFGAVKFDKDHNTVSFPAVVNQRTGIVEYAVVAASGKTHESIFRTEAQPAHIHIAMLLLGVKAANTNEFPPGLSVPLPGEPVSLEVSWREGQREQRRALEDFIVATTDQRGLSRGPWIYNGSHLARRNFLAQRDGSIVSVQIDPDALINNPRAGRENDALHSVNSPLLPAEGLPLEITIRLSPEKDSP